jgi:predicted SnoaL-like aldol condensation-catalyzing enzyme
MRSNDNPTRKECAISFLKLVASGNVRKAYEEHIAADFCHHNPYFKGDAESLMHGMEANATQFPDKILEVQRALEDGDLVAVHSHVKLKPGDRGLALVHIFRFRGNAIVELWDLGQPVPEEMPNELGMF